MKVHEHHHRSLVKAITYTAAVIVADAVIIAFFTQKADVAIEVIIATNLASLIIYYVHARIWNQIHWGRSIRR